MDGRPWLSQSNQPPLTSPPDKANNHLLGERRQRISTNYATPPRRENRILKEEREILKKATQFFAGQKP